MLAMEKKILMLELFSVYGKIIHVGKMLLKT